MASLKMNIENRDDIGSNRAKKLRVENMIPGVIYKRGTETKHVQVDNAEFLRVYKAAGTTSIIDLQLDGKSYPVIIKDIQTHPVKNQYVHIDFQELNMDETIRMFVPVYLINRDNIPLQPSILIQSIDEVEIECLPGHIPTSANVDVIDIDFTTPIFVEDLDIVKDENITILTELDEVVCTLTEPTYDEEAEDELADLDVDVDVPLVSEDEEEEATEEE